MSCSGIEFYVHLTGPIWGWTTDIIMTDEDGDGIYSITMEGLKVMLSISIWLIIGQVKKT